MQSLRRKSDKDSPMIGVMKFVKNKTHFLLIFSVIVIVTTIMCVTYPLNKNLINNENNAIFEGDWEYSMDDKEYSLIQLPFTENNTVTSHITLKNQLPNEVIKGATILLRTSQQYAKVYVDDEPIYNSYIDDGKPHPPSSAFHFVRLPTDCSGKEITVELSSPYQRYVGMLNQIYIGSKASHIFHLIGQNGFKFIIGFLVFSIGLIITIAFLFAKENKNIIGLVYLGGFFASAGFWVIVESKLAQFIVPYPTALTNIGIFALTLMPIFLGLYYHNLHKTSFQKISKYTNVTMLFASLAVGIIAIIDSSLPLQIMPFYVILLCVFVVLLFGAVIILSLKSGRLFTSSFCGMMLFFIFGFIELTLYLIDVNGYDNTFFITLGLFLFCIFMIIDLAENFTKIYQASIRVNALTVLAYTDSLTGLQNRTAFLEKMSTIDSQKCMITIAMFDINNLKIVNDTMGHLVGDAMIRHSVKALKTSLRDGDEIYRIGGDEFVAVLCHYEKLDYKIFMDRLDDIIAKENHKALSYKLSVAYGYATFSSDIDKNLFDTLARADEKMYSCKKLQKSELEA